MFKKGTDTRDQFCYRWFWKGSICAGYCVLSLCIGVLL